MESTSPVAVTSTAVETTSAPSTALAQGTIVVTPIAADKPAFEPYYKPASAYEGSRVRFTKKPERPGAAASGAVTTTFGIHVEPVGGFPVVVAPVDVPMPTPGGRGGRGGRGAGRGRGRGAGGAPRLPALAIKPANGLLTRKGIAMSVQTGKKMADRALANKIMDSGDEINALAIGMMPLQQGHHFEILFYLDMNNAEDRRLKELSDESRDAFMAYTYTPEIASTVRLSDNLVTNGFVRTSESGDNYIVMQMSTMHTDAQGNKFYPTPFSLNDETVLWNLLVRRTFRAEIEFKVSHVMLVNDDKASFKTYISSCKLLEEPKMAISIEQQGREDAAEKMKQAVIKAMAERKASGAPALVMASDALAVIGEDSGPDEDAAAQLHEMMQKAREQIPVALASAAPGTPAPITKKKTKVAAPGAAVKVAKKKVPPPPPADSGDEAAQSGDDVKSVEPSGMVVNVARAR